MNFLVFSLKKKFTIRFRIKWTYQIVSIKTVSERKTTFWLQYVSDEFLKKDNVVFCTSPDGPVEIIKKREKRSVKFRFSKKNR